MQKQKTSSFDFGQVTKSIKYFVKSNWQKIAYIFIIFVSIVSLIYSLSFSTGWAQGDEFGKIHPIGKLVIEGANPVNIMLVNITFITIILVLISFMFGSHNRKKYYWTNYASMILVLIGTASYVVFFALNVPSLQAKFMESLTNPLYESNWNTLFLINNSSKELIVSVFTFGYVSFVLAILSLAAGIAIVVTQFLARNVKQVTYSDVIKQIEAGEIVVDDSNKRSTIDYSSDSINIDFEKHGDIIDMKVDKLRYQKNSAAYLFVMISVILLIIAGFTTYTYSNFTGNQDEIKVIPTLNMALDISLLIVITLMTFLAAEKLKFYQKNWVYILLTLSAINILRIFFIPLISFNKGELPTTQFILTIVYLLASVALQVWACIISYRKIVKLEKHLEKLGK